MVVKKIITCSVEGCERQSHARGLCEMHYQRLYSRGTLTLIRRPKGTGSYNNKGYLCFGNGKRVVGEHVLIAEKALGKPLPKGALIHHVNENRLDNRPENLVICPNRSYHQLIHRRMRAYAACGHADWRKCTICKHYDSVENLTVSGFTVYHYACMSHREKRRYKASKNHR